MRTPMDKPRFIVAAEERARQKGTSPEEILRQDSERARHSEYPGPGCLAPEEVESFLTQGRWKGKLASRKAHVERCLDCAELLVAAAANRQEFDRIMVAVRDEQEAERHAAQGELAYSER